MGGRHRSSRGSWRAGWFVAGTCASVVALSTSLVGIMGRQPPPAGPGIDPEAGVSMRTYPVPQPTPTPSDAAGNLRKVDSPPPTTTRPTYTRPTGTGPTATHTRWPSPTNPERTHPGHPRPSRVCYVFRYHGHTYRFCGKRPPHH